MTFPYRTLIAALGALAATACSPSGPADAPREAKSGGTKSGCLSRAYPEIGGPISLVNDKGEAVTQDTFKDHPTLIYFGFTYCPDVCPMTLVTVARAYKMLPEGMEPPQTLLISIDPERDTPEKLAEYVATSAFPDNLGRPNRSARRRRPSLPTIRASMIRAARPATRWTIRACSISWTRTGT